MQVVYPACCGLDVNKRSVTACRITSGADGEWVRAVRNLGTAPPELAAQAAYLADGGITTVAMESTGV